MFLDVTKPELEAVAERFGIPTTGVSKMRGEIEGGDSTQDS